MIINIKFDEQDDNVICLIQNKLNEFIESLNEYQTNHCIKKCTVYGGTSNDGIIYVIDTRKTKNGFNILIKKEEVNE